MIELSCPHCGKTLRIPDQYAGQQGKCNGCGNSILVPSQLAARIQQAGSYVVPAISKASKWLTDTPSPVSTSKSSGRESSDYKSATYVERKAICHRIAKEMGDSRFFTRKELGHLPAILMTGEQVLGFTSGLMDGNTWLIVLTDRRIIFLDRGFFYGLKQSVIDLDKVNTVSGQTGLILGSISIQDGASNRTIRNVPKRTVLKFTNKVQEALQARKSTSFGVVPQVNEDLYSKLERLAALQEKGILTAEEFKRQKEKLLEE